MADKFLNPENLDGGFSLCQVMGTDYDAVKPMGGVAMSCGQDPSVVNNRPATVVHPFFRLPPAFTVEDLRLSNGFLPQYSSCLGNNKGGMAKFISGSIQGYVRLISKVPAF